MLPAYWSASCLRKPVIGTPRDAGQAVAQAPLVEPADQPLHSVHRLSLLARVVPLPRQATLWPMAEVGSGPAELDGHEVTISNPGQVFFARGGHHQARPGELLPGRGRRGAARGAATGRWPSSASSNGAEGEVFFQKRAPKSVPEFVRDGRAVVPLGAHRRRGRRPQRGRAGLGGQPGLHRPQPAPGAGRRPGPSRRAAGRPRPGPGRAVGRRAPGGPGGPRGARGPRAAPAGPRRPGSRGIHVYVRIERRWTFPEVRRAALALAREVERRAPEHRHQQVVEGGAPRRLPRLQPERQGPDGGLGLLGPPDARRARSRAPLSWDEVPDCRAGGLHPRHRARAVRAARATSAPGSTRRRARWSRCWSSSRAHEAEGQGDAPWPPHYAKAAGRAAAGAALQAPDRPAEAAADRPVGAARSGRLRRAGHAVAARAQRRRHRVPHRPAPLHRSRCSSSARRRDKADALAGLDRWRARHPEAAAHVRDPEDVLVDGMRGRSSLW